jgi:LPXTG-site transpeptidase (sortase) family protein
MVKKRKYIRRFPKIDKPIKNNPLGFFIPLLGIVGGILIIVGILMLVYFRTILSFSGYPNSYKNNLVRPGSPVNLTIPAIDLTVSIKGASIINGIWQTDSVKALHLSASANPGENGNIVIYGHNTGNIFGRLNETKFGNSVIITSDTGSKYVYIIDTIKTVSPNFVSIIGPSPVELLTIYTCSGFMDTQRFVIQAHPAFASNIKPNL